MVNKDKIIQEAFIDELEKIAFNPAPFLRLFSKGGGFLKGLAKGSKKTIGAMRHARKTALEAGNVKKTIEAAGKATTKKPGIIRGSFGKARENLHTLLTNPARFGKRVSHKAGDVIGATRKGWFRGGKVVGFHNGQTVLKRTPASMLLGGVAMSGPAWGTYEFMGNKYDNQGRQRSLGNRLGRATFEAAKWTVAPGLAGAYELGSMGFSAAKNRRNKHKSDPFAQMQQGT